MDRQPGNPLPRCHRPLGGASRLCHVTNLALLRTPPDLMPWAGKPGKQMAGTINTEAVVVGGGPAGLVAAGMMAASGVPVALVAPPPPPETRTTALMQSSLEILARLGLWPSLAAQSGALKKVRLVDASGSLVRAPETLFDSAELGLTAFGHNIENTHLLAALRYAVEHHADIRIFTSPV